MWEFIAEEDEILLFFVYFVGTTQYFMPPVAEKNLVKRTLTRSQSHNIQTTDVHEKVAALAAVIHLCIHI